MKLLKASATAGVEKIIIAGSSIEYGLSADEYELIPVTAALKPTTPYAASKASGFELAHAFCINHSLSLVYKRIFSAYGLGQFEGNFWPSLRSAALAGADFPMTSGNQIRDFIPVEQVAKEFLDSVEAKMDTKSPPVVENVCSGIGVTVLEFAQHWWAQWGAKGILMPGAVQSRGNEPARFVGVPAR